MTKEAQTPTSDGEREREVSERIFVSDNSKCSLKNCGMSFYGESWERPDAISTQQNGAKTKNKRGKVPSQ